MSQQKILLTVCLVAGFIAAAYGQDVSLNPMQCGQKSQTLFTKYLQDNTNLLQSYTQQIAQTGNSAFDVQGFSDQAGKLVQQYGQLGDTTQGFSLNNYASQGTAILAQQMKLATFFMRGDLGVAGMQMYMSFVGDITSLNTKFISQVTAACLSG